MKSLTLVAALFFSSPVWAAVPNMCERVLNDILQKTGIGKSLTEFNSSDFKSATLPLSDVVAQHKKLSDQIKGKMERIEKMRQESLAENQIYSQAVSLPKGKVLLNPFEMLDLFSDEKFVKSPNWRGSYVYDEKGEIASALAVVKKTSSLYESLCGRQRDSDGGCRLLLASLNKKKTDLYAKLTLTGPQSDKILKAAEAKGKPSLDKIIALGKQVTAEGEALNKLDAEIDALESADPNLRVWNENIYRYGDSYEGMKLTTLTMKVANNYDKERIQILQERRKNLLTQKSGTEILDRAPKVKFSPTADERAQFAIARKTLEDKSLPDEVRNAARRIVDEFQAARKQRDDRLFIKRANLMVGSELNDVEAELSVLQESPTVQVLTRNGLMTSFVIGPPLNFSSTPDCENFEFRPQYIKPEILNKNLNVRKMVFAAYGINSIEEYATLFKDKVRPKNFDKYFLWAEDARVEAAKPNPRKSSGRVTEEPAMPAKK